MRSFADYRKKELKKTIHSLSFSECMNNSFDILRLDLLEAVKLPELLFENSLVTNSIYESARKGDYEDNKQIIEFLVQQFKCGFYQEAIREANDPNLLVVQVKELIQSLRDSIGNVLKASRPVGGNTSGEELSGIDPGYDSENGFAQAAAYDAERKRNKWKNAKTSPEEDISVDNGNQNPDPNPVQGFSNYLQKNRGQQQQSAPSPSIQPARPSGQPSAQPSGPAQSPGLGIRPKDGYWAGIKRSMIDPAKDWVKSKWQNFKKRWHNQGLGEHSSFLENVMLENFDSMMDIVDKFETDLIAIIDKNPPSGPGLGPIPPSDTVPVNPRGSVASNLPGTGPAVNDKATADILNSIPDETNAQEVPLTKPEQVKEDNIIKGAKKGAEALGIKLNIGNRIRTIGKVRSSSFQNKDGSPIGSEPGYDSVVLSLAHLIKSKIEPEFDDEYLKKKSEEKGRNNNTLRPADILPLVLQWLKLPKSGLKNLSVSMLDYYNRKITGTPDKEMKSYGSSNATEPMGANVPATGNATEPMGSDVSATEPMGANVPATGNDKSTRTLGSNAPISPRGRKSKGQATLDEFKEKADPVLLNFYLNFKKFKNDESLILKAFNDDPNNENPKEYAKNLINGLEEKHRDKLANLRSPSNTAPEAPSNVAPANTSPVSPVPENPTTYSLSKIRAHIDADLAKAGLKVNTSSLDDNALISLIGKNTTIKDLDSDNDGPILYSKILKELGVNTNVENETVPSAAPVEKAAELPTTPVARSNPLQAGSDEMKAGANKSGGLKRSPKTDTEKSLETPSVGLNKNYFANQEEEAKNPEEEAQKQLSGTEGYGKFIQDYKNFVKRNKDDIDYSWEDIENDVEADIVSDIVNGMTPEKALENAKDKLRQKIEKIDKKSKGPEENKIDATAGFEEISTKDIAKQRNKDKAEYDKRFMRKMKKEGFNRVLTKFRKLIHS